MSRIKEILCLHHSHLDIGYTHPQPLLLELQKDYINEAIELCKQTEHLPEDAKFRWTCEATYPVMQWLETAAQEQVATFHRLLHKGQMSIAALPFHTSPLVHSDQLARMLYPIRELRERFGIAIQTAINHDVNGQPWPLSQVLLDAGIEFYITGINIHFGGIPFPRPAAFRWRTPDNRELLTFHGEHYSLFSQFFQTYRNDTKLMAQGIEEYIERLERNGYPYDFIYLTATNPPLYDNNCPDPDLVSLLGRYNAEGHEQKVLFATPEMLLERVRAIPKADLPVQSGDWTDYWNFGSGSSARETRVNRLAKQGLKKAEFLEAVQGTPSLQYSVVKHEALKQAMLYDEHTWGAASSITAPDHPEILAQRTHKSHMAYQAADLSTYVLAKQMEAVAGNPLQSTEPEGIILVNTSDVTQQVEVDVPEDYHYPGRHLAAARSKDFLPYGQEERKYRAYGTVELAPFSWKKLPLAALEARRNSSAANGITVTEGAIDTPYYRLTFNSKSGRIVQLFDKRRNWSMVDESSPWTLFEFVRETIDGLHQEEHRSTFFPRDIDKGNQSITVWNHDWKAKRVGANRVLSFTIEQSVDTVTYVMLLEAPGVTQLEQRITFSAQHARIGLQASMDKLDIRTPESVYFAFPLSMDKDWRSHYDTAGMFVELDREQLGNVCRDWLTVDQSVSIHDGRKGITLACPDAPLVQVGDFNFGKESKGITRDPNPVLLAWAMNNYWDTNFWASQPGRIHIRYELSSFDSFDPIAAYQAGVTAAKPVVMNAAIHCAQEEDGRWFHQTSETIVPLYVKPASDGNGLIVTLRNLGLDPSKYVLSGGEREIVSASLVNPLEEELELANYEDGEVRILMKPGEMTYVRINLK